MSLQSFAKSVKRLLESEIKSSKELLGNTNNRSTIKTVLDLFLQAFEETALELQKTTETD